MPRSSALDGLKLLLSFMIIGLHAGFFSDVSLLWSYVLVNGVFRIAVPLFFLINGYYLYQVINDQLMAPWLNRAFRLYCLWMIIYAVFWFNPNSFSIAEIYRISMQVLVGYHHLWYFPAMIGGAVLLAALRKSPDKYLIAFITLTFALGVVIQYLGNYHFFGSGSVDYLINIDWRHRNFLFFAFPFLGMGYLLNKYDAIRKADVRWLRLALLVAIFALFYEVLNNFLSLQSSGDFDNLAALIFVCPLIFLLTMRSRWAFDSKVISTLATAVFLIHSFVLSVLRLSFDISSSLLTLLTILISVAVAVVLLRVNKYFHLL